MQSDDRQSRSHAVGNDRAMDLPEKTNLATIQHEGERRHSFYAGIRRQDRNTGGRYDAAADSILIGSNRGTSIHDKELQFAVHTTDKPVAAGSVGQSPGALMGVGEV